MDKEFHFSVENSQLYPATPAQKRMFSMYKLEENSVSYNMPQLFLLDESIDLKTLANAVETIVKENEILRTNYVVCDGEIMQRVIQEVDSFVEISKEDETEISEQMKNFIRPFSLENDLLIRAKIISIRNNSYLLLDIHHINNDEESNRLFLEQLEMRCSRKSLEASCVKQYREYSSKITEYNFKYEETEWKKALQNMNVERLDLPKDYPVDYSQTKGGKQSVKLPAELTEKLYQLEERLQCTSYSLFMGVLAVLLKKICYQDQITIGFPVSSRTSVEYENMLGLFVNSSIVSVNLKDSMTLCETIEQIREQIFFAIENVNFPFEQLSKMIHLESLPGQNPLFDVMLNYYVEKESKTFIPVDINYDSAKVDLSFQVIEKENESYIVCEYYENLYRPEKIKTILDKFVLLLGICCSDPNTRIEDCDTCLPQEKNIIFKEYNPMIRANESKTSLQSYLKAQALRHPNKIAAVIGEQEMTFEQLDSYSDAVAAYLHNAGVKANMPVPLITERSLEMLIGIWGILKSGGAYLPIKPEEPFERMMYMIENAKARYILEYSPDSSVTGKLQELGCRVFRIPDICKAAQNQETHYESHSMPNDLAYIIYTSGTTGKPKGVMVEHHSVINRIDWMVRQYHVTEQDRLLQKTTFTFDVSVWEIFMGVFVGATLYLLRENEEKDPGAIAESLVKNDITMIHFVPSMLNAFLGYLEINPDFLMKIKKLRYVFASGEALKRDIVRRFYEQFKKTALINLYGPTECTVDVTHYECTGFEEYIPIGKPIDNINAHILNGRKLAGIGFKGELCISGVGVARGYINNSRLTAERFIENEYGEGAIYRTGDIASWTEDGNIRFYGRKDRQIKARGYRIELGEIEEQLQLLEEIKDVIVLYENEKIIACVVSDESAEKIKNKLAQKIPAYMIPHEIIHVENISLSKNGKAAGSIIKEKKELPDSQSYSDLYEDHPNWKKISEAVCGVLDLKKINGLDNFRSLGGDSIKAIMVANALGKSGLSLMAKDILETENLYALVEKVTVKSADQQQITAQKTGAYKFTGILHSFFHEWKIKDINHFNQSCLAELSECDESRLTYALNQILKNQEMLRAAFFQDKFVVKPYEASMLAKVFRTVSCDATGLDRYLYDLSAEVQEEFLIEEGNLFRAVLIRAGERTLLYLCMHHLVTDAVSWKILLDQWEFYYHHYNDQTAFPDSSMTFGDWQIGLEQYRKKITKFEKSYWLNIVKKMRQSAKPDGKDGMKVLETDFALDEKEVLIVRKYADELSVSVRSVVLAAVIRAVNNRNETEVLIDIEGHGREDLFRDKNVFQTIGWFTTIFPVVIKQKDNLRDTIVEVESKWDELNFNGIGYGLLKEEFMNQGYQNLQAPYCFNYLGEETGKEKNGFFQEVDCRLASDTTVSNYMNYRYIFDVCIKNGRMIFHIVCEENRKQEREKICMEIKKNFMMQ